MSYRSNSVKLFTFLCLFLNMVFNVSCVRSPENDSLESSSTFEAENAVEFLTLLKQEGPLIQMNASTYEILARPRTDNLQYKIIALFTTLNPERGCKICIPAYYEFMKVVQAFENDGRKTSYPFQLFFALVDFDESPTIFRKLKVVTAPLLLHMSGLRMRGGSFDRFDIKTKDVSAADIALWINSITGVQIILSPSVKSMHITRELWFMGLILTSIAIAMLLLVEMYKTWTKKYPREEERPILKPERELEVRAFRASLQKPSKETLKNPHEKLCASISDHDTE